MTNHSYRQPLDVTRCPSSGTNSPAIFPSVAPDSPDTEAARNDFAEFWPQIFYGVDDSKGGEGGSRTPTTEAWRLEFALFLSSFYLYL